MAKARQRREVLLERSLFDAITHEDSATDTWGPVTDVVNRELRELIANVQVDLHGLTDDLRRGPLARILIDGQSFLGDLRKTFLRHHRRLIVHIRAEGGTEFQARVRQELGELADSFRVHVLSRASKSNHEAWSPGELSEAIDRILEALPPRLEVPVEASVLRKRERASLFEELQRLVLRSDHWLRSALRDTPPKREVELRSFLGWHVYQAEFSGLEGISVLLVQAEVHLEGRARSLFELVARTFDALIVTPDELDASLEQLRAQVEEELVLAEEELSRFIEDIEQRLRRMLAQALQDVKAELPDIGTFRLRNRRRTSTQLLRERKRKQTELLDRLAEVREASSGGYVLLGLRLELAAFRVRATQSLESEVADLERSVRGRSSKQIERVRSELDTALAALQANSADGRLSVQSNRTAKEEVEAKEGVETQDAPDLARVLENLQRVLHDAQRSATQLVEQLESEHALHAFLDSIARRARGLTNYYRVPTVRLAHTEWTLPRTSPVVELPLGVVVADFVEMNVAPELLATTQEVAQSLVPMLTAFSEVERVVHLGGGQLEGDDALVRDAPEFGETWSVLHGSFLRAKEQLDGLEAPAQLWAKDLARSLRTTFQGRLAVLDERLTEGGLAETAAQVRQRPEATTSDRLLAQLARSGQLVWSICSRGVQRVRLRIGEGRLVRLRRGLGLRSTQENLSKDGLVFDPPEERLILPPFYRRLFAGQATWAGDVLETHGVGVAEARRALASSPNGNLRTVVVVGTEGSGRRALLGAVMRGDRFGQLRKVAFTEPAGEREVRVGLEDLGHGQLVVVTGFSWLVSAADGGFAGLRAFVEGIVEDRGRNAFLLEADDLVWQWGCSIAPLEDVFARRVNVPVLGPRELEEALMARHRLSGLTLKFDSESEDIVLQRVFTDLYEASDGLLQLALAYWLGAIEEIEETPGYVRLGAVPKSPHEALRQLEQDTLHTLYVVARQGWMSSEVLGQLLGRRESEGAAILTRMCGMGLLERSSRGYYLIRRHLRGGLRVVFDDRGWT